MPQARFTQADIARMLRAFEQVHGQKGTCEIAPDGNMRIVALREPLVELPHPELDPEPESAVQDYYKRIGFDPKTMPESELYRLHKVAEDDWRASIPGTPLNKRERKALMNFKNFEAGVLLGHGQLRIGLDTAERLAARGFVEIRHKDPNIIEGHVITASGLAASRELADDAGP